MTSSGLVPLILDSEYCNHLAILLHPVHTFVNNLLLNSLQKLSTNYLNLSMPSVSWEYPVRRTFSFPEVVEQLSQMETFGNLYDVVERTWALKLGKTGSHIIRSFIHLANVPQSY